MGLMNSWMLVKQIVFRPPIGFAENVRLLVEQMNIFAVQFVVKMVVHSSQQQILQNGHM
jgi:hypothetical protein